MIRFSYLKCDPWCKFIKLNYSNVYMQNCVACICLSYLKLVNHLCSYLKMTTSGVEINLIQCLWELYKFDFIFINSKYNLKVWRRQLHPTPGLLPGKSHEWRSLVGCSPWGRWVGHDWATSLSLCTFMHWRRKWQPTPVFLPGESQGQGSLVGCRLWGRTELDMTEVI